MTTDTREDDSQRYFCLTCYKWLPKEIALNGKHLVVQEPKKGTINEVSIDVVKPESES